MFQNAVKCDMVSTTSSKMPLNATWFRQHVPNLPNLPTYQPTNLHLYLYLFLVHAQHSCACTTLLCMHWRGQGPRPGPNKKAAAPRAGPAAAFCLGPGLGLWPLQCTHKSVVHAQECCACTRILCMHKNLDICDKFSNLFLGTSWYVLIWLPRFLTFVLVRLF